MQRYTILSTKFINISINQMLVLQAIIKARTRIPAPTSITHKTHFFRFFKLTRHLQLYACVHNKIIYKENSLFGIFIYSIKFIVAFQILPWDHTIKIYILQSPFLAFALNDFKLLYIPLHWYLFRKFHFNI